MEPATPFRRRKRSRLLRWFLRLERRIISSHGGAPRVITQPGQAEAMLAALAGLYPDGEGLSVAGIAAATGLDKSTVSRSRRWAKSVGRWPYRDCTAQMGRLFHEPAWRDD